MNSVFWIAPLLVALWAFAPRILRATANARALRAAALLQRTGRWAGLALLGLFIFGLGFGVLVGFPE